MIDEEFKTDMELIYIYIDKYRTFEKQECAFSNKFKVSYNAETKDLTITRNKDYFDIYPGNILGINAVLGKNASGKTSFMSLIGERIESRRKNIEIYTGHEKSPHEKNDLSKLTPNNPDISKLTFVSKYFLVYYYGKDYNGEDLFIFETCCPEEYISIFENYKNLNIEEIKISGKELSCYISNGWLPCVFKVEDNKNICYSDTQNYKVDGFSPEMDSSIIFFKNSVKKELFRSNFRNEEESIISVKRVDSVMEDVSFFQKMDFLINQMNQGTDAIYNDKKYILQIKMAERIWYNYEEQLDLDGEDVIPDYRDYLEKGKFSEEQKIVLAFLNKYVNYILSVVVKEGLLNNEQIE